MTALAPPLIGQWQSDCDLAECPSWWAAQNRLLFVDIVGPAWLTLDPVTGAIVRFAAPAKIGAAAPMTGGEVLQATASGLWSSGGAPIDGPPLDGIHYNDGKCDAAGRFVVGTRASDGSNGGGALWRIDGSGWAQLDDGFDVPNGLGWSPDGRTFYLIDTIPRILFAYDYDAGTGAVSRRRVLYRFSSDGPAKPDGLAVDDTGQLWIAMWDGARIDVLSPAGARVAQLPVPARRPTSCAFGGPDGATLFVTTARWGLDRPGSADGGVLAYDLAGFAVGRSFAFRSRRSDAI